MGFITATTSNWFLIGPISVALGWIMNWIFEFLDMVGLPNIGLAIILFTFVIKALMIPLSVKQQKFSKLQTVMQPELNAIAEKYKGKEGDNAAIMARQEETKEVYGKYGVSATGGCLQLIIQMPILFALYQVIYHMPGHIAKLKGYFDGIAAALVSIPGFDQVEGFTNLVKANGINLNKMIEAVGNGNNNYVIDLLYKLSKPEWNQLFEMFNNSSLQNAYNQVAENITRVNTFLGIDLTMKPTELLFQNGSISFSCWWVIFIPLLAGALQYLSTKMMPTTDQGNNDQNGAGGMLKSMNVVMPLMSVVFCFMFEAGLGVYWVASSGVQCLIQLIVNKYMDRVDIDQMIEKNMEKVNKKRAKKGLPPKKVTTVANSVHTLEEEKAREEAAKKVNEEKAKASSEFYQRTSTAKKGSLAEKAGMVQQYDERMKSLKGKNGNN